MSRISTKSLTGAAQTAPEAPRAWNSRAINAPNTAPLGVPFKPSTTTFPGSARSSIALKVLGRPIAPRLARPERRARCPSSQASSALNERHTCTDHLVGRLQLVQDVRERGSFQKAQAPANPRVIVSPNAWFWPADASGRDRFDGKSAGRKYSSAEEREHSQLASPALAVDENGKLFRSSVADAQSPSPQGAG